MLLRERCNAIVGDCQQVIGGSCAQFCSKLCTAKALDLVCMKLQSKTQTLCRL